MYEQYMERIKLNQTEEKVNSKVLVDKEDKF
jgi:hypothetical protein